jgi:hypothetical protein
MCPECKGAAVNRSRRRSVLDHVLSIFGMYPYRCQSCMYRFRAFGDSKTTKNAAEPVEVED